MSNEDIVSTESKFEISIIHKTYKFYLLLNEYIDYFPKRSRYTIGQKAENKALELMEWLYLARSKKGPSKLLIINKADIQLQILKTIIRLTKDTKSLDMQKHLRLEEGLQEIGRMLGGWIKSLTDPENPNPPKES